MHNTGQTSVTLITVLREMLNSPVASRKSKFPSEQDNEDEELERSRLHPFDVVQRGEESSTAGTKRQQGPVQSRADCPNSTYEP